MRWLIIFLIAVSAVSGFYIWKFTSSKDLNLSLEIPDNIISGVPFELKVNFSNNSDAVLNDTHLTLILPEGAAFVGSPIQKTIDNKNLGNIGAGGLVQEQYNIIILSSSNAGASEASAKEFKAVINYAPASLGARFEKSEKISVRAESSAIKLEMAAPEKIMSGENFELNLSYKNISDADLSGLKLKLEYPPSFSFISSSLKPDTENNEWRLGDLLKNSEGKLTIKGNIIGNDNDNFQFKTNIFIDIEGESYMISENNFPIAIAASPFSLKIHLNNNDNYTAKAGDELNYTLSYVNGTENAIRNAVITTQLAGEMFDFNTVQTQTTPGEQGFFQPSNNTITWQAANNPALALISPGSAGAVSFQIKTKNDFPIRRFSDKNFVLYVFVSIDSSSESNAAPEQKLSSKEKLETKVGGNVTINTTGYFRDAESGFLNQGPFPPKAGQKTDFTVHWLVKSFASDLSKIEVRGTLAKNVKMVGDPKSNSGSLPIYDPSSNQIVWQVDKIQANQGAISNPIEAIFQIEAAPGKDQIGSYMPLIGQTTIQASDDFTGKEVENNYQGLNTALPDDATISQQGIVQP